MVDAVCVKNRHGENMLVYESEGISKVNTKVPKLDHLSTVEDHYHLPDRHLLMNKN
jgi:hypothetical protein